MNRNKITNPLGGSLSALRAGLCAFALAFVTPFTALAADGYANVGRTTTGGAGGPSVTVTTLAALTAAARDDVARVVNVSGTINLGTENFRVGSNKTIQGVGANSGFIGNIKGVDESNIIIQRLNFTNPNSVADGDGLTLDGCTNVWVDHCSFVNCGDGSLDITHGSDFVTVSWCKFSYTVNTDHNFVNLIGHSDNNASEDTGKLHVTMHHNWWSTLCVERMPRVRFGRIHVYNNYINSPGNNYCVRASLQSQVLVENNYFENIDTPYEKFASSSATGNQVGLIRAVGNTTINCTGVMAFNDSVFAPPYSYSLAAATSVKASVMAGAGTGGTIGNPPNPPPPTPGGTLPADGTYKLRSRTAGLMLDNLGVSANGANVALWANSTSFNQRWVLSYVSANVVKLQCVTGSRFLDGLGRTANGSAVGQWDNGTSNNQRWTIIDVGGGFFKLRNVGTSRSLDVGASPWANGDICEQWPDGTSQNQHWQFVAP